MRLADLQRAVQRHVLDGGILPATLEALVAAPAAERFEIYVEAYRLRLIEALAANYPVLAARMGREAFADRMRTFIDATPSVHRSIRDYGGGLPAALAHEAEDAEGEMRAELAAFEWRLAAAFDAAAGAPAAPADLAPVAPDEWPQLRFQGVPSLQRLATRTNAVAVWRAVKAAVESGADVTAPVAEPGPPVEWLILRPGLTTEFRSLSADEAEALDRLLGGGSFGEVCASFAARAADPGAAAASAAGFLKGWLQAGALERV